MSYFQNLVIVILAIVITSITFAATIIAMVHVYVFSNQDSVVVETPVIEKTEPEVVTKPKVKPKVTKEDDWKDKVLGTH